MLINEVGVPDFWVTLFTSQALRKQTQSSINSSIFMARIGYRECVRVILLWAILHLPEVEASAAKKSAPSSAKRAELSPKQAMSDHTDDLWALML